MDQHPGMRETRTLAFGTGAEQHRAHRSSHARADRRHIGLNQVHSVVDRQPGGDLSAGGVDVQRDISPRIGGCQEEQLGLDDVRHIVIDRDTQEDDPVHHQTAENVHRCHVQLPLLDDHRIDVSICDALKATQGRRGDTSVPGSVFLEFFFIHKILYFQLIRLRLFQSLEFLQGNLLVLQGQLLPDSRDDLLVLDILFQITGLTFV